MSSDDSGRTGPSSRALFFRIFPSIVLPMFVAVIDQTIVATALPAIAADLGNVERISWVVVSYLIAVTISAPVYGRLGDLLGRRRLMFFALAVVIVASVGCALAQSMVMLVIGRVFQGLGGGGLVTLSQAMIAEAIPPRDRARYQGYLAAVAVTSNTLGPVVGGFLTEHFGWQSVFLINIPAGLLAVLLTLRLPAGGGPREPFRFDTAGLVLFATFITTTLLAMQHIQSMNLEALPLVLLLSALAAASAALFLMREKRASHPLVPLSILRNPSIWRCDLMAALHGAALVSLITFVPIYLRVIEGRTPAESGWLLLPMTAGIGCGSLITGRLISRTGYTAVFPSWGLLAAALLLGALALWAPHMSALQVVWLLGIVTVFMGTLMAAVQVTVQAAAGSAMLGTAAATVQFSRALGAAFGTAAIGAILFMSLQIMGDGAATTFASLLQGKPDTPADAALAPLSDAFRFAFLGIALFAAGSSWLAWTLPLRKI